MWFNEKNAIKKLARNLVNDMFHMNVITIERVKHYVITTFQKKINKITYTVVLKMKKWCNKYVVRTCDCTIAFYCLYSDDIHLFHIIVQISGYFFYCIFPIKSHILNNVLFYHFGHFFVLLWVSLYTDRYS